MTGSPAPVAVVSRWVAAFNARDLDAMLACLHRDVALHPLRLFDDESYHGHDGVRRWFGELTRHGREHRIALTHVRSTSDARVLAIGSLQQPGDAETTPICGLYDFGGGLITIVRHYFSDPDTLERIAKLS